MSKTGSAGTRVRAAFLGALSVVLPSGLVASCAGTNCASPAYHAVTARLVAMRGPVATYAVGSVEGGFSGSTAKVGPPLVVRYTADEAKELRVGETYRVEVDGTGGNLVSSISRPCGARTSFTDGSKIVSQSWWQRNHTALAVSLALVATIAIAAIWVRRRRSRGGDHSLAA